MELLQSVKVQRLQTGFVDTNSLGYPPSSQSQNTPAVDPVQTADQIDLKNQDQLKRQNQEQQQPSNSDAALTAAMKDFQDKVSQMQYIELEFSLHKGTGRVMVKVIDKNTGKVIREIPDKKFLDLVAGMDKMIGILFDKKV